ncbi:MAG: IS481 family transposase [Methylocella sp.]
MGEVLHGCARTTEAVRRAIQHSQKSLNALAGQHGINPKTVAKWKKRTFANDAPMGPKEVRSTVLTKEDAAAAAAFRKYTLLPLDDCLYALQPSIPHLTRSSLHRCLQRHGISRRPEAEGDKAKKQKFAASPIGCFHAGIAEVQPEDGKLDLFVAVDRASKFADAELHPRATRTIAKDVLDNLTKAVPSKIHAVLTDNGIQFTKREGTEAYWVIPFDRLCDALGSEHRLTKINHPWTNGQVERMNRTIKEATARCYHYQSHAQLKQHLHTFLMAYTFAKRRKTLKGLTPYEHICKMGTNEPERFNLNPFQHNAGLNKASR